MSNLLNRDALLEALRPKVETVLIEGLGAIGFRSISTADRLIFNDEARNILKKDGKESASIADQGRAMLPLLPKTLVDGDGNPLLNEGDIETLLQSNAALVQRLLDKALEVSGLTTQAVEEAEGNSETSQS